jgi:hypothetical protein
MTTFIKCMEAGCGYYAEGTAEEMDMAMRVHATTFHTIPIKPASIHMTNHELIAKLMKYPGEYLVGASGDYMGEADLYLVNPNDGKMTDYLYSSNENGNPNVSL